MHRVKDGISPCSSPGNNRRRGSGLPYYIYVIELDRNVLNSKKFMAANPNMSQEGRCFYVGQSCLAPEERFQQHKSGYKANRFVKEHGLYLRRRTYSKHNPIETREEALLLEEELAERLRKKGHAVWWH